LKAKPGDPPRRTQGSSASTPPFATWQRLIATSNQTLKTTEGANAMTAPTTRQTDHPRIYVACLAAYNSGFLHGAWIEADQDAESIYSEIRSMLAASPIEHAEEWAIHDYEGFCGLSLSEYEGIEQVAAYAAAIAEHGEAWACYAADVGIDYAIEHFEDAYCGAWESELAYASELFDELYSHSIPAGLRFYIDYDAFARDLFINDYSSAEGESGTLHIFSRHI
jgi:antirestriction protein